MGKGKLAASAEHEMKNIYIKTNQFFTEKFE